MLAGVHAGHAICSKQLGIIKVITQIIRAGAYLKNDAAAVTAVATIRAATRYEFLTTETGQTVSSFAGFGKNTNVIYEHERNIIRKKDYCQALSVTEFRFMAGKDA